MSSRYAYPELILHEQPDQPCILDGMNAAFGRSPQLWIIGLGSRSSDHKIAIRRKIPLVVTYAYSGAECCKLLRYFGGGAVRARHHASASQQETRSRRHAGPTYAHHVDFAVRQHAQIPFPDSACASASRNRYFQLTLTGADSFAFCGGTAGGAGLRLRR